MLGKSAPRSHANGTPFRRDEERTPHGRREGPNDPNDPNDPKGASRRFCELGHVGLAADALKEVGRAVLVVMHGQQGVHETLTVRIDTRDQSLPYANDPVAARLSQLWKSHDPAGCVVVLEIWTGPRPRTAVGLGLRPCRDSSGQWCPRCGARLTADHGGECA